MKRFGKPAGRAADEEESVFVTMTDMTVSFLFVIMILLAFFAAQIGDDDSVPRFRHDAIVDQRDETMLRLEAAVDENESLERRNEELEAEIERLKEPNPLEAYLAAAISRQGEIVEEIRDRLAGEFPDLQVGVSPERDALRFQGEGLFRTDSSQLDGRQLSIVQTMGELLNEILACHALGPRAGRGGDCYGGNVLIEAVLIEGHTDADGDDVHNLELSTDRAIATFFEMLEAAPGLGEHLNLRGQPVLSVSGYGKMRPVATNETEEGKAANRRIDLRFIVYAPKDAQEVEEIGRELDRLRSFGGER